MLRVFIANYRKYGEVPTSHDLWKLAALTLMVIDHIGAFIYPDNDLLRAIGRICVPIWLFLVGYARPSRRDYTALLVCALLLVAADALFHHPIFPLNILFTIILCRLFIEKISTLEFQKWQSFFYIIGLGIFFPTVMLVEYGTVGMCFSLFGYLVKTQPGSVDTKLTALLVPLPYFIVEYFGRDYTVAEAVIMGAGIGLVCAALYRFRLIFYKNFPIFFATPVMFIARNSLYFYTIHLIIFVIISFMHFPEDHMHFLWF